MSAIRLDVGDDELEVWIERAPLPPRGERGVQKMGFGDRVEEGVKVGIDRVGAVVRAMAKRLNDELHQSLDPDELTMEFGLSVEAGPVFVGATGTFKVTLKWTKAKAG